MADIEHKKLRLVTVKQLPKFYPAFSESSIRWLVFNEKQNGFTYCIRRIGRKVLISLDEFEKWIDSKKADDSLEVKKEMLIVFLQKQINHHQNAIKKNETKAYYHQGAIDAYKNLFNEYNLKAYYFGKVICDCFLCWKG